MTKIQQRLKAAKSLAQAVARGEVSRAISDTEKKIVSMGYAYEEMLGKYLHKPTMHYFNQKNVTKGQYSRTNIILLKAANIADKHSVTYPVYIRSQFYWFDLWFHRAPRIYEISGHSGKFPAEKRLTEFLKLEQENKVNKSITSVVMPRSPVSEEVLDKINRQRLNQLCKVYQLTEEEALKQFAPVGLFDLAWLKTQPGY